MLVLWALDMAYGYQVSVVRTVLQGNLCDIYPPSKLICSSTFHTETHKNDEWTKKYKSIGTWLCCWNLICENKYRIRLIRRRGYYLFHHAILCGFYLRAVTIRERHLLNSVVSVKSFVNVTALRKPVYNINKELRCGDFLQSGTYTASARQCTSPKTGFHTAL